MIQRGTLKAKDVVLMGRPNGMKAQCRVKRVNDKTCTVVLLEKYGNGRSSAPGSEYRVPWSMLYPVNGQDPVIRAAKPEPKPFVYNMFTPQEDKLIIEAIGCIYGNLSPENLACDGERPVAQQRQIYREQTAKLALLQKALGREVSESEYYAWLQKRDDDKRLTDGKGNPMDSLPPYDGKGNPNY